MRSWSKHFKLFHKNYRLLIYFIWKKIIIFKPLYFYYHKSCPYLSLKSFLSSRTTISGWLTTQIIKKKNKKQEPEHQVNSIDDQKNPKSSRTTKAITICFELQAANSKTAQSATTKDARLAWILVFYFFIFAPEPGAHKPLKHFQLVSN